MVLGVVHDRMRGGTYVAERGGAATLNGDPIRVSDAGEPIRALLVTGFPYDRADMRAAVGLFGRLTELTQGVRRLGAAALDLCYVAAGRLDAYYEKGLHAWDVAAGSLIIKEAGGRITDYQGRELDLEGREIVASNGLLHPVLLEVMGADHD